MPIKKHADYIPIKCEGWNGRFVYGQGATNNVSKVQRHNQNVTDASNFYGFNREPIVLPPTWDGTFKKGDDTHLRFSRNYSDVRDYVNATQCHMMK